MFVKALIWEIHQAEDLIGPCDTLYFGGGTPSLLEPAEIGEIIEAVDDRFHLLPGAEITLEANPGTLGPGRLAAMRALGVNRLNIGVQSFQNPNLAQLGRIHCAGQAMASIHQAREAGFTNLGLDMMYGLPGQNRETWLADLEQAVALAPEHLSCYMLTFEPGTPFDSLRRKGEIKALPEGRMTALFLATVEFLKVRGYAQYEISNFSRTIPGSEPDLRSRHNRKYWTFAPYRGLGPSAHSYCGGRRFWNHRDLDTYLKNVAAGILPVAGSEVLSTGQRFIETVYLGLRQTTGLHKQMLCQEFQIDWERQFGEFVRVLVAKGMMLDSGASCVLTPKGMTLLDSIAGRLINGGAENVGL